MTKQTNKRMSIIWNTTRLCSWNCSFCCVDAEYCKNLPNINKDKNIDYRYKNELSYAQKISILDQLKYRNYRIDFSGGELMIDPTNLDLVLYASEIIGKENIGVSTSGAYINKEIVEVLSDKIYDIELSMDYVPFKPYILRPIGYHEYAANAIKIIKTSNIRVGVQTVLSNININKGFIDEIFEWLIDQKVDDWSLLRFMPVGRGENFITYQPSVAQYIEIVDYIKKLNKNNEINLCFHYLLPNHDKATLKCRACKQSIGILPNGDAVACFWGLGKGMVPYKNKYSLGNLLENNLEDILQSEKSMYWKNNDHICEIVSNLAN